VAASAVILCLPGLSIGALSDSGGGSEQTVTVKPSQPSSTPLREARQAQAVPPGYVPPLHGSNPHGQGTVGTIDLGPNSTRPLPVDPVTGRALPPNEEEVVVGRSRGEQRADGTYHGHITILSLFANEIAGVDTNAGETKDFNPLGPILNPLCMASGICLKVLRAHSETTTTSSNNEFKAVDLNVGAGGSALTATAAESRGNISTSGGCQTAHGDSQVAGAKVGGVNVQAALSSSDSQACTGKAPTQLNKSNVILNPSLLQPVPAPGCGQGTANTLAGIPTLLPIVCNADDTNGNQAAAPYGVREALTVFALVTPPGSGLLKVTAAASESRAQAPPAGPGPGPDSGPGPDDGGDSGRRPGDDGDDGGPGGPNDDDRAGVSRRGGSGPAECEDGIDNDRDGKIDFPNDPQCQSPNDDSEAGELAFTGVNLVLILLAGTIMLAAGLALRTAVTRSPRAAA